MGSKLYTVDGFFVGGVLIGGASRVFPWNIAGGIGGARGD